MNKENSLEILPLNFRHEKKFLLESEFNTWSKLRKLKDVDINFNLRKQGGSKMNFKILLQLTFFFFSKIF